MTAQPSFVAIDPGYAKRGKGCAVAVFQYGRLLLTTFERPHEWRGCPIAGLDFVIFERPQYEGGSNGRSTRVNPEVLIQLGIEGALLAGLYAAAGYRPSKIVYKTPRQWKGSIQKPVHHAALWDVLDDHEKALLGGTTTGNTIESACEKGALDRWAKPGVEYYPTAFLTHNLLDAVALGCQHIGRLVL